MSNEVSKTTSISVGGDVKGSVVTGDNNTVDTQTPQLPWWQGMWQAIVKWLFSTDTK